MSILRKLPRRRPPLLLRIRQTNHSAPPLTSVSSFLSRFRVVDPGCFGLSLCYVSSVLTIYMTFNVSINKDGGVLVASSLLQILLSFFLHASRDHGTRSSFVSYVDNVLNGAQCHLRFLLARALPGTFRCLVGFCAGFDDHTLPRNEENPGQINFLGYRL
jgi:hypothetical protein